VTRSKRHPIGTFSLISQKEFPVAVVALPTHLNEVEPLWQAPSRSQKANHAMIFLLRFSQHATDQVVQSKPRTPLARPRLVQWVGLCCRILIHTSTDRQRRCSCPACLAFKVTQQISPTDFDFVNDRLRITGNCCVANGEHVRSAHFPANWPSNARRQTRP